MREQSGSRCVERLPGMLLLWAGGVQCAVDGGRVKVEVGIGCAVCGYARLFVVCCLSCVVLSWMSVNDSDRSSVVSCWQALA